MSEKSFTVTLGELLDCYERYHPGHTKLSIPNIVSIRIHGRPSRLARVTCRWVEEDEEGSSSPETSEAVEAVAEAVAVPVDVLDSVSGNWQEETKKDVPDKDANEPDPVDQDV